MPIKYVDSEDKAQRAQANLRELDNVKSFKGQSYNRETVVIGLSQPQKVSKDVDRANRFVKAAELGDIETVKSFITNKKCDINCIVSNVSALITSAANGNFSVVKFLIENGSDINLQNRNGINALIAASCGGHLSIVSLLVRKNCSLDAQSFDGNTALMDACNKGHIPVAVALVTAGCNTKLVNKKGKNAMDILKNKHPSLVVKFKESLDGKKSPVESPEIAGKRKLTDQNITKKSPEIIESSEKNKAQKTGDAMHPSSPPLWSSDDDDDVRNKSISNPRDKPQRAKSQPVTAVTPGPEILNISSADESFIRAVEAGDFVTIKNDLSARASLINCKDRDGMTPLSWASIKGLKNIVEFLLTFDDCDVDNQDRFGTTALILACCAGHIDVAIKLLQSSCDQTIKDVKGKTAFDYLRNYHPEKCAVFLDAVKQV
jgi:serine/threonine-protein phosphatase 6 regulatory ankyrin repeat subunit B